MKILIAGYGHIGKAMVDMLKDHYEIEVYDPYLKNRPNNIKFINKIDGSDCVLGIVCVPTPSKEDGSCDTSIVENVVKQMNTSVILIKSTIEIGTTDKLIQKYKKRIVFSPEYFGESEYWQPYFQKDIKETPMLILGGNKKDTSYVLDLFAPVLGPVKNYYQCDAKVAETVKYMENTFYALKVTFVNEMYEICKKVGVDYWDVREAWLLDPRINRMHTAVFKNKRGFGGKCFPKDVLALIRYVEKQGYEPKLLKEVIDSNKRFRGD